MPTTFYGTNQNDERVVRLPMTFTFDGLAGVDTLSFGTSLRSAYTITQADDGAVMVDSVSGASDILHAKLYNVEKVAFNEGRDLIDLATYFQTGGPDPDPTPVTLNGSPFDDLLRVTTASATVDGLAGTDTVSLAGLARDFALQATDTGFRLVRSDNSGTVDLASVERLAFSDQNLALDLDFDLSHAGNAASVALILGAVFGTAALARPDYVGIGLALLDSGAYNPTSLVGHAIDVALGEQASPRAVVDLLYFNLVGALPDDQTAQGFVDLIASNGKAWLGNLAACHPINQSNIDLVGLQQSGLVYS